MIPYIAALILLIVVILYQVYVKTDGFTQDASGNAVVDASGNPIVTDASDNVVVTDVSDNVVTSNTVTSNTTADASGNVISNEMKISLSDLFGLLGPFKMDASGNPVVTNTASTAGTTITAPAPAAVTPGSGLSAQEITDRLAKAVSKQVKDDLISQHTMDTIHDKYAPCDITNSEAQGQEYTNQQPLPSQQPDMSEYIRKDSIPCWNCAVP